MHEDLGNLELFVIDKIKQETRSLLTQFDQQLLQIDTCTITIGNRSYFIEPFSLNFSDYENKQYNSDDNIFITSSISLNYGHQPQFIKKHIISHSFFNNVQFINNTHYYHGVPFHGYLNVQHCIPVKFDEKVLCQLLLQFSVWTDLIHINHSLRQFAKTRHRQRIVRVEDSVQPQFITNVCNSEWIRKYKECFTDEINYQCQMDINQYADKKKLKNRDGRKYILHRHGYNVKNSFYYKMRLLFQLRCYEWFQTKGVVQHKNPPWNKPSRLIISRNEQKIQETEVMDLDHINIASIKPQNKDHIIKQEQT